jgi:hypothetical protein
VYVKRQPTDRQASLRLFSSIGLFNDVRSTAVVNMANGRANVNYGLKASVKNRSWPILRSIVWVKAVRRTIKLRYLQSKPKVEHITS